MRFARFGQHGDALGDLSGVLSATRERGVDGTDELTITCTGEVAKYDRLVWRDPMGRWVESMAYEVSEQRGDSAPVATAYAGPGWRERWVV